MNMDFKNYNNLIELFFEQYTIQQKDKIFFIKSKRSKKNFTWENVKTAISKVSSEIRKIIQKGDRCLLISENRPEWMISDLSIMLAGGITVPAYTTYVTRDYEYIIDDCSPSVIFVSNDEQYKKIRSICERRSFVKRIFSFEKLSGIDDNSYVNFENLIQNENNTEQIKLETNAKRSDPACIIYTWYTRKPQRGSIKPWRNIK